LDTIDCGGGKVLELDLTLAIAFLGWFAAHWSGGPWITFHRCRTEIRKARTVYANIHSNLAEDGITDEQRKSDYLIKGYETGNERFRALAAELDAVHVVYLSKLYQWFANVRGYDLSRAVSAWIGLSNTRGQAWMIIEDDLNQSLKLPRTFTDDLRARIDATRENRNR
jgi:hypothetical protein